MSKAFLKWAGGKRKLVPFIESHLPNSKRVRLIEPFVGAASVTLALEFEEYMINDVNTDLINIFEVIRDQGLEFIDYCESFFIPSNNNDKKFYELREAFNNTSEKELKAALFIYLNRHSFNGLCRYNNKGAYNVPFGKYKAPYFPKNEMIAFHIKSSRIKIMNSDFVHVFTALNKDDIIYCDPPYVPLSETSSFTQYAQNGFTPANQIQLAKLAEEHYVNVRTILISNHDTNFTREIYNKAYLKEISVQRNIAANGNNRTKAPELLAIFSTNPCIKPAQSVYNFQAAVNV